MTRDIQDCLQHIDIENSKAHTQTHTAHSANIKGHPRTGHEGPEVRADV